MNRALTNNEAARKIHPHKFAMYLAMGSIAMMFAGLTSAYMVRHSEQGWRNYHLPPVFWVSTAAILLSSVTMVMAIRAFRNRRISAYKGLLAATLILGVAFGVLQFLGFYQLYTIPQQVVIAGVADGSAMKTVTIPGNPSESFLFIIAGLHLLHILGGIVALVIVHFRAYSRHVLRYRSTGLEIVASYWHFVDVLWIYLFIFFLVNE